MTLTRTRRRILIATLVVISLAVGGLWRWHSRVDRRFVGTWAYMPKGGWHSDRVLTAYFSDGWMGIRVSPLNEVRTPFRDAQWWVQDGQLEEYDYSGATGLDELTELIRVKFLRQSPRQSLIWRFDILEATSNTLRLRDEDGRISEYCRVERTNHESDVEE